MARKWIDVVFLQGEEADEALAILDEQGDAAALEYLSEWDRGGQGNERDESPAGDDDCIYSDDHYEMSYNTRLGYIGLCRVEE